jgi:hypothetical protein
MIAIFICIIAIIVLWCVETLLNIYFTRKKLQVNKIAIASMVTNQSGFDRWLDYHINTLGVDKIYLRVENSPIIEEMAKQYPEKVIVKSVRMTTEQLKNNYFGIQDRQKEFISDSITKSKKDHMDILFHVDADEFIKVRHGKLKDVLGNVPDDIGCIHFKNFEALYKDDPNKKCFEAKGFIDCTKQPCTSYANGKSAGVLKNNPKFHGPHFFTGKVYNMPDTEVVILHFDSCTFDTWKSKFQRMNSDPEKLKDIPFSFYKGSIEILNKDGSKHNELVDFYSNSKSGKNATQIVNIEHFKNNIRV